MDDATLLEAETYSQPHVVFRESPRSPSPVPVSDRGALSPPPTSPPETLEERRQFQEALASITPLEMLGWEAAPPFHAAPAPRLSHTIMRLREQCLTEGPHTKSWPANYGPS